MSGALAPQAALDHLAEFLGGDVLEVEPGIAQALVLAQPDQLSLGRSEAFFQGRDDDVGAGEVGPSERVGPRPNCSL